MITNDNAAVLVEVAIAEHYCKNNNYPEGLKLYKEVIPKLEGVDKSTALKDYTNFALRYAGILAKDKKWEEILSLYSDVMKYPGFPPVLYKNVGLCLSVIKSSYKALRFFDKYKELFPEAEDVDEFMGEVYSEQLDDYKTAITYYEKALEKNPNKATIYSQLAHLYSTLYRDKERDKQIQYAQTAVNLDPMNRIPVKNAAYIYSKFGDIQRADALYGQLMLLKPNHSDLHSYGAYLVRTKRFKEGFKFLRHRFQKEDLDGIVFANVFYGDKMWDGKSSLEGKDVLVCFEQGFGDTIMFSRYLKLLKKMCKSVQVIVQDSLVDLLKDSKLGVPIYSDKSKEVINYDVVVPLMDLPLVFGTTPETIPLAEGYLKVPQTKVKEYGKQHIQDKKKFKIGIAFEGSIHSKKTRRDIPLEVFYPLMQMPEVDVYILQVGDLEGQIPLIPPGCRYINLGTTFKNWEDTACAIQNMDLVVTSDNGVMNLAGALGKKTFGMFNSITEWRWFKTDGEDIAWYKSIKPFQCPIDSDWVSPMNKVVKEVKELTEGILTTST